jgi:hypothetical protein
VEGVVEAEAIYYGERMEIDVQHAERNGSVSLEYPPTPPLQRSGSGGFSRVASWFSGGGSASSPLHQRRRTADNDELADFDESEWTPPDSSYGAAIPVGGWIPKPIRRMIEWTLIALVAAGVVYVIVTTSIHLTDDRKNYHRHKNDTDASDTGLDLDDRWYIEYSNDDHRGRGNDYDLYDEVDDDAYQGDAAYREENADDGFDDADDYYADTDDDGGRRLL